MRFSARDDFALKVAWSFGLVVYVLTVTRFTGIPARRPAQMVLLSSIGTSNLTTFCVVLRVLQPFFMQIGPLWRGSDRSLYLSSRTVFVLLFSKVFEFS